MVRGRLIMAGIADPLRQLPDMHAILDVAEFILTEHMDQNQLDRYNSDMYRPALTDNFVPAGFDQASQMAAFTAFAASSDE